MQSQTVVIIWCAPSDRELAQRIANAFLFLTRIYTTPYVVEINATAVALQIESEASLCHQIVLVTERFLLWHDIVQKRFPKTADYWVKTVGDLELSQPDARCVLLRESKVADEDVPEFLDLVPEVVLKLNDIRDSCDTIAQILNLSRSTAPMPVVALPRKLVAPEMKGTGTSKPQSASAQGRTKVKPPKPPIMKVFISYTRVDRAFEEQLLHELKTARIDVWVDHEKLTPGTVDWEREIRQSIANSDAVVYVGTAEAIISRFVRDELNIAHDEGIKVFPIWARGEKWSRCAPLGLGYVQYADARAENRSRGVQELITSLKQHKSGL